MPVQPYSLNKNISQSNAAFIVTWNPLATGDTGAVIGYAEYAGKTFQAFGTFNGSTLTVEGSNDGVNWFTVTNWQGTSITFNAPGGATARDMPAYIRPNVSGGTATAINFTACLHRTDMGSVG